jgi:hypothetical protein
VALGFVDGAAQLRERVTRGPFRGQTGDRDLEQDANLGELGKRRRTCGEHRRDRARHGLRETAIGGAGDEHATAWSPHRSHTVRACEQPHRLTHRRPTDVELTSYLLLGTDAVIGPEGKRSNLLLDQIGHAVA